jgi:hypothetical protein
MGQNQPKESEGKRTEATGSPHNPNNLKDRVGASFQQKSANVVNPNATGTGSKGNPGKPT